MAEDVGVVTIDNRHRHECPLSSGSRGGCDYKRAERCSTSPFGAMLGLDVGVGVGYIVAVSGLCRPSGLVANSPLHATVQSRVVQRGANPTGESVWDGWGAVTSPDGVRLAVR
jgi:hypothetical protein